MRKLKCDSKKTQYFITQKLPAIHENYTMKTFEKKINLASHCWLEFILYGFMWVPLFQN